MVEDEIFRISVSSFLVISGFFTIKFNSLSLVDNSF